MAMDFKFYNIPVAESGTLGISSADFKADKIKKSPMPEDVPEHNVRLEGGIMVNEDTETMKILASTKSDRYIIQCKSYKNPPKGDQVLQNVPEVRYRDPSEAGVRPSAEAPPYNLFTYRSVKQDSSENVVNKAFIYTGSSKVTTHSCVTKEVYIPLDELKTRLIGDATSRRQAYLWDWGTYCAHRDKTTLPSGWTDYTSHAPSKTDWDGRHLSVRNSRGEPTGISAKFLTTLLTPVGRDRDEKVNDIPLYIFQRWAQVAYAAGIAPKSRFSVMARFYHLPKELSQGTTKAVTFWCAMTPNFFERIRASDPKSPVNAIIVGNKALVRREFNSEWKKLTQAAIDNMKKRAQLSSTAVDKLDIALPKFEVWDHDKGEPNPMKMELLGTHPEGYYCVYISKEDLENMKQCKFNVDFRKFKAKMEDYSTYGDREIPGEIEDSDAETTKTETEITATKMSVAAITPRNPSQLSAMSSVGNRMFEERIPRAFEWLHRSAYSYGGLKGQNVDSSQKQQNMVFGTFEANTAMIRTEEYLKRVAKKRERTVSVQTRLIFWHSEEVPEFGPTMLSWLVPKLDYNWQFPFESVIAKGRRKFWLLSQRIPTRVEVELDAEVENQWWQESVKPLHTAYLRSQHALDTTDL